METITLPPVAGLAPAEIATLPPVDPGAVVVPADKDNAPPAPLVVRPTEMETLPAPTPEAVPVERNKFPTPAPPLAFLRRMEGEIVRWESHTKQTAVHQKKACSSEVSTLWQGKGTKWGCKQHVLETPDTEDAAVSHTHACRPHPVRITTGPDADELSEVTSANDVAAEKDPAPALDDNATDPEVEVTEYSSPLVKVVFPPLDAVIAPVAVMVTLEPDDSAKGFPVKDATLFTYTTDPATRKEGLAADVFGRMLTTPSPSPPTPGAITTFPPATTKKKRERIGER